MAPRNWASGFPSELLSQIFELCNYFHRARFAAVCRPWHTAKLQTSKLLSTPWLMLSLPFDYRRWLAASSSADLDPMARLRLPDINGLAAIGSSPDGWLVFVDMENEILVLNPLNKVSIQFPSFKTYPEATPLHIILVATDSASDVHFEAVRLFKEEWFVTEFGKDDDHGVSRMKKDVVVGWEGYGGGRQRLFLDTRQDLSSSGQLMT
ncbi:hypothetical protein ZIOFF_008796 [Zingiber officinale]|uniref:F-box domain-containing protein n=1 Tax=Zingiber officinale TaxID=94328 RepID=A0A8J5I3V8_ZINOF|nr:hypothetical protein ZIOFF_008796 [Zingiber officinale]